jgi:ligand-binding sensor domain-containing protein/signal transduction histidine kinase
MKRTVAICTYLFFVNLIWANLDHTVYSQLKFNYLTIDNGLSYNKVNCIARDPYGLIWFGTNEGLNLYDGYQFRVFRNDIVDTHSISHNFIINLLNDSKNRLWICTFDGLNRYDFERQVFHKITLKNSNRGLGLVYSVYESTDGTLWIAARDGLFYILPGQEKAEKLTAIKDFSVKEELTVIFSDQDNKLWVGSMYDGLFILDLENNKMIQHQKRPGNKGSLSGNWITAIFKDKEGNMWLGTNDNCLNKFNAHDSTFTRLTIDPNEPFSSRVRDILQDGNGRLWLGTRSGLYLKDKEKDLFTRYAHSEHDVSVLSNNSIYDIYIDKHEVMWLGTFAGGVNYADFNQKKFIHFKAKKNDHRFLSDPLVYSIFEDSNNDLWIGTEQGGLNHYNFSKGQFTYYQTDPNNPKSISSNNIKDIKAGPDGRLWIATYHGGINVFDRDAQTFSHCKTGSEKLKGLISNNINQLLFDSNHNLWVGTDIGLQRLERGQRNLQTIPVFQNGQQVKENVQVISLFEDKDNQVWIGTWGHGLLKYDPEQDIAEHDGRLTRAKIVYGFNQDKNNNFWICSENGLVCQSGQTDSLIHFTDKDGLPANNVYMAIEDDVGNMWISTSSGLVKFNQAVDNPEKADFTPYDVNDGLQSKQFRMNSYHKGASGYIYFGGVNGLNAFLPGSIGQNPHIPQVVLTSLNIFNKEINIDEKIEGIEVLRQSLTTTGQLNLSYQHYIFSIEFASNHFVNPGKNQYAYMLEGFDRQWNLLQANQNMVSYSNLPGGEYTFKVKAENNDGLWNENPTKLKITVKPPFWDTTWFKLLLFSFIALVAFSVNALRVLNLKKQKQILEKTVDKRTAELKTMNKTLHEQKDTITKNYHNIQMLSEFGQKLTATLDFENINKKVYAFVSEMMDVSNFAIAIFNVEYNSLDFHSLVEDGKPIPFFSSPLNHHTSCASWCYGNQQTLFSNDFQNDYKTFINDLNIRTKLKPKSLIYYPLSVDDKKIGIITVQSFKKNAYSDFDLAIIKTLASYVAIALDNSSAYRELRDKNKRLYIQTGALNDTNTQLEERQQVIEEQSEELRAQAEELNARNNELKELNKTKDRLFSIIAHDLKNPFSSILGFSELLIKRYDKLSDDKRMDFVNNIHDSAKNIFRLLENMLSWSRSQSAQTQRKPEKFPIKEVVESNFQLLRDLAKSKKIKLSIVPDGDALAFADKNMINTVVRNLISNAIKFTENGEITCSWRSSAYDRSIFVSVGDTGSGIEKDRLKTIFDVEKSKSTVGTQGETGTGLGLIICKEFVEKNKGIIYAESNEGKGSIFTFTVPMAHPET